MYDNIYIQEIIDEKIYDLVSYTGKKEEEVLDIIENALKNRNLEWELFSKVSPLHFHCNTKYSMYCLVKWNSEKKYQDIIKYISYISLLKGGKILDFGGGIGELSINLANKNFDISFLEVPGNTLNFAKWRFKKRSLDVNIYTSLNQIREKFNIIIALDVIEVLEKPEIHIKKFYDLLNYNGLLILSKGNVGEPEHPMNLSKNKNLIENLDTFCGINRLKDSDFENKFHLLIKEKY
jgi:2-polyprenyl-3-methyl-5-hydroxy-6-metoxy-1,4-benzoquinol methylase